MAKKAKEVRQKEHVGNSKSPKVIENPDAYLKKHPIWAFHRCDKDHEKWAIRNCERFYEEIVEKLISLEGMTWAEIQSASGGRRSGTNSHFESINSLCKEAQNRFMELHLDTDEVFSLRLTGTVRIFGIMENGTFNVLWYDPKHEICPSNKRNT